MSEDFGDLFADSASFSPYESSDHQFLTPILPPGAGHKAEDTGTLKDDDDFDWFNDDRNFQGDHDLSELPAGEDWFFSEPSTSGYGSGTRTRSTFDDIILSTRNGGSRQVMTSLSDFTRTLAELGVDGPRYLKGGNLDRVGRVIGVGTQFTVFIDGIHEGRIIKRVNRILLNADTTSVSANDQHRSYFRTLELEVLSLCHPPLRDHRNIVDLVAWGFDYPTPDPSMCLPVLIMEGAMTSLSDFLQKDTTPGGTRLSWEIKHQMCLDISDGLEVLHKHGIVHGDIKPDNVLVFTQDNPNVPYLAKLSDFGVCIWMEQTSSLSFGDYLGTPGWIPAEVVEYREDLHGEFSPELLLKCDSFSYGMVVLSVLMTCGRLPFSNFGGEEESEGEGEREEESPYEKAMGLIWGSEDESFPAPLRGKLISLCRALLKERPHDRADVSHLLLADNSKGYNDWVAAKEVSGRRARVGGGRENDANKGPTYWMGLHSIAFKQLEQHFIDTKTSGGPGFPGETLFGMAIYLTVNRSSEFEKKILNYIGEAAKASYFPAQAIIKRLYEAHGQPLATIADNQLMETWLFNAASTGSFVAAGDLAKANPDLLKKAKTSFRKVGGYNGEFSSIKGLYAQFSDLSVDMARRLCDRGGVESLVDLDGNRLLHVAAMFGKPDVINYLVRERGAAVNSRNDNGETPLYKACLAGHHSVVEALITLSADASITSRKYNLSPLHWLFNFEEQYIPHTAELLVSRGKAKVDVVIAEKAGVYGRHISFEHFPFHWPFGTPLHWAASTRSITAIDALLSLGADINAVDSKTEGTAQTALAMAARRGDGEIVRYLLKMGANAKTIDSLGRNLFHMMAVDYTTSNRLYRLWGGFESWVYNGPYMNHLHEVRGCILAIQRAGVDLDRRRGTTEKPGHTPLIDASYSGNCVVALALLEAGANANCLDFSSQQPFHIWAAVDSKVLVYPEGFSVLFQQLVERMEDLDAKGGYGGETVMHIVMRAPHSISKVDLEERVRLLTTHNPPANINACDKHGRTPLFLTLENRGPGEAAARSEILLRYKARVDHNATKGSRDFIFVICFNPILTDSESHHLLKKLLEGYSDAEKLQMATSSVSRANGIESTAISEAIRAGKFHCVKYLLELGMDPNAIDKGRCTALDWALIGGNGMRRNLLNVITSSFTVSERKVAIEKGLAFGVTIRDDDSIYGDYGIIRENYLALPKIINYLVSIGAKRAKDFVEDGRQVPNPTEQDEKLTQNTGGWFTVENQPYYEEWKVLYSLCD